MKIGDIYKSNKYGDVEILEKLSKERHKVRFLNTGYEAVFYDTAIRNGEIRDKYCPSVAGVGFIGDIKGKVTDPEINMYYRPWNNMLNRCNNENDGDYDTYGGIGITVDKRWYNLANFIEDAKQLPNADLKEKYPKKYQLDKDYLQLNIPKEERVYSKDTCMWLSKADNSYIMNMEKGETLVKYRGVVHEKTGNYLVRISNKSMARYTNLDAAANMYNHYKMSLIDEFSTIDPILNTGMVPMTQQEASKYSVGKITMCRIVDKEGSTTIPEGE